MTRIAAHFAGTLVLGALIVPAYTYGQTAAPQLQQRERYHLHAGDQLKVEYTYTPELNETFTIQPDGYVVLITAGAIPLAGKTLDEATALIKEGSAKRLENPTVTLTLIDFQKPYFVVAGQVTNPMKYDLRENTSALQAVMLAGGITNKGTEKQVIVFHHVEGADPTVHVLNFKHLEKQNIFEHDMELSSGDIVYVPHSKLSRATDIATVASTFGIYLNAATYLAIH